MKARLQPVMCDAGDYGRPFSDLSERQRTFILDRLGAAASAGNFVVGAVLQ